MSFFDDEQKMYVPLSIDNAATNRSGYFFSNRKVVEMALAVMPYFFLMYPMMSGGARLFPMLIVTICFGVVYIYFFRFRILEENRLRSMVNELDKNKISGLDHFWQINKLQDNGVIHYVLDASVGKELGIVVAFDRGSTVGVPKGNFTRFRQTKMQFLRELHLQGFDYTWYELPKRSETPNSLINYFNLMSTHQNEDFRKLLKLQIDINNLFVTDAEQPYVDYILIRNHNFRTLRRFRQIIQDVMDLSLATNGYILNPRILNKTEVEAFFEDYLMVDSIDANKVRRGVIVKPFDEFGKVTRIVRHDGVDVPIEFIERFDFDTYENFKSVEQILLRQDNYIQGRINDLEERKQKELDRIRKQRLKDQITDKEYKAMQQAVEEKFAIELEEIKNPTPTVAPTKVEKKSTELARGEEVIPTQDPMLINMQRKMADRFAKLREEQVKDENQELSLEERLKRQREKGE